VGTEWEQYFESPWSRHGVGCNQQNSGFSVDRRLNRPDFLTYFYKGRGVPVHRTPDGWRPPLLRELRLRSIRVAAFEACAPLAGQLGQEGVQQPREWLQTLDVVALLVCQSRVIPINVTYHWATVVSGFLARFAPPLILLF
jgi:hypothetical protein